MVKKMRVPFAYLVIFLSLQATEQPAIGIAGILCPTSTNPYVFTRWQAQALERERAKKQQELEELGLEEITDLSRSIIQPRPSLPQLVAGWKKADQETLVQRFQDLAENVAIHTAEQSAACTSFEAPVRELYTYTPSGIKRAKKDLMIVIHGTFSHHKDAFKNEAHEQFQSIMHFAADQATHAGTIVDLISFGWNAYNNHSDRLQAGKNLALLLDRVRKNYDDITVIAHSHGCNVVNIASHFMKKSTITTAIYMACPVRDKAQKNDNLYEPTNRIKNIYSFYSPADPVAFLGSFDDSQPWFGFFNNAGPSRVFDTHRDDINIINIYMKSHGIPQGHSSIRKLLPALPQLLDEIKEHYPDCHELMAHNEGTRLVIVALDPAEKLDRVRDPVQKHQIEEYSQASKAAFKANYNYDMETVPPLSYFTIL